MTKRLATVREERGAIAVMTAILMSGLLLVVAAIGVDLGNAWSRKLNVQKSVDVSAISAGAMLPRTSANEARDLPGGRRLPQQGQQQGPGPAADHHRRTAARQQHRQRRGHLHDQPAHPPRRHDEGRRPRRRRRLRLRRSLRRPDSADVTGEATVRVGTPVPSVENVLPMWLPSTCVYGPLAGDIAANPPPNGSPSYTLNTPNSGNSHVDDQARSPGTAVYATPNVNLNITINDIPAGRTARSSGSPSATRSTSTTG